MKRICLLLFSLFLMNGASADVKDAYSGKMFYEQTFDQSNGLVENTVSDILQDRFGYIWISTWGGLMRYDGSEFSLFKSKPADSHLLLPSNRISCICESSLSDIWCIINSGVYLFRRDKLQFEEVCADADLQSIAYVVPKDGGLSWLMTREGIAYEVADDNPKEILRTVRVDMDTEDAALYRAANNDFVFYADDQGNIRFRNLYNHETGLAQKDSRVKSVYGISPYRDNKVLVCTDYGVYVYDSPASYTALPGWEKQYIRSMCVDNQDNIWLSNYPGLTELSPVRKIIMPHKVASDRKDEFVRALYHDSRDRTWIADKNHTVRLVKGDRTLYLAPDGALSTTPTGFGSNVYCICEDHRGVFWLGTKRDGLYRLVPKTGGFEVSHYAASDAPYSLNHSDIYAILEDNRQQLWIGTHGGGISKVVTDEVGKVTFLNPENTFKHYPKEFDKVRCLYCTPDGVMLVGTTLGLVTYATGEPAPRFFVNQQQMKENSLAGNDVMQIAVNGKGEIYLACFGGGINKIDDNQQLLSSDIAFSRVADSEDNATDAYLTLAFDRSDNLWVVSEMFISKYSPQQPFVHFSIRDFGDHFIFSEVQPICVGNQMLVGTTQGLLTFEPETLSKSSFAPTVTISRVTVEGKERMQDFNVHPLLSLDKDERNLILHFSTLDFNRTATILYKYRIAGFDKDWKVIRDASLNMANIPSGRYTLEVTSTNGDGMWNCEARQLQIDVKPKFNETVFAKLLYSLSLILLGFFIYRVTTYIYRLRAQIEDIQLAANEKVEKISKRIQELLGSKATLENLHTEVAEEIVDKQRQFTDKLMEYMNQNIERTELQVSDIASYMGVSKTLLYIKTKEALNCTPLTLINDLRIKRAIKLLEAGHNVSLVAYSCGFSDPHYFSRCFKKATGKSPSEYTPKKEEDAQAPSSPL